MPRFRSVFLVLSLALISLPVFSQKYTGTIRGIVTDSSGAMVPNAQVTATNTATNASRTVESTEGGEYVIPDLPAGTYNVKATGKGFKETIATNVNLHVASTATINMSLQVGSTSETITVESSAIRVETSSAGLGEVVTGDQVRELPLNGRSFVQLTQLQPGVSPDNSFDPKKKGLEAGVDFAVNGNPTTNNLFLVDGANNNDVGSNRTILTYPSIDSIAEFKMLRNAYGPEYGQASGSVITIITRSGTNSWHGGVNYFGRNDALNATEYFAARDAAAGAAAGTPRPNDGKDVLRRHDYAYNIGGPIFKDKLFVFWSQEWNKEKRGQTRRSCVPTAAERIGDFRATPLAANLTQSCGVRPSAATVPGGIIANPDAVGLLLAQLFPLPNQAPSASNDFKNWSESLGTKLDWRQENLRLDYNLTSKNTATFRYTQDSWNNPAPNTRGYWGDDPFPAVEGNWDQPGKSIVGKVTSVLTNTLVNDAQFSYSNNRIFVTTGGSNPELADQLSSSFPTVFPEAGKRPGGIPTIWSGLGPYGDSENLWLMSPFENAQDLYTVRDDISKTYANHTFKVGAYLSFNKKDENDYGGGERPDFGSADWAVTNPTGNQLANILLPGQVFSGMGERSVTPVSETRWRDYEFYFGDTWKARRNLTIEYGARWSFFREPDHARDLMSSWDVRFFNPAGNPNDFCNGLVIVPGTDPCGDARAADPSLSFLSNGTEGPNSALRENNNHLIAPRFGLSWDPWSDGKTAVRLGVGQFFQRERVSPQLLLAFNAPFAVRTSTNRTLAVAPPLTASSGAPGSSLDPTGVVPNAWQWNFSVEREMAKDTTVQVAYVGNRGLHLTSTTDANPVTPANRTAAAFAGAAAPGLRFAPNFGKISRFARTGASSYHALQTSFRTRLLQKVRWEAVYTWSHSIADYALNDSSGNTGDATITDPFNHSLDRGNSTINRPHIFVTNAIVNFPSFADQQPVVRNIIGDWEFATITTFSSGNSQSIFTNGITGTGGLQNLSGTGINDNHRPNAVAGVKCSDDVPGGLPEQIFNPGAFTFTGYRIGTIGTASRGACPGPTFYNWDLALYKNWKAAERLNIQFRMEFFNAFNNVNFLGDSSFKRGFGVDNGGVVCGTADCSATNNIITGLAPGANISTSFGRATRTRGPREIQYALKFTF